jgi:YedE family putative selenium metabolism protein
VAASRVLAAAAVEARRLGSDAVGAEHILLSLLQEEPTTALLDALGIAPATAAERLASGSRRPRTRGGDDAPAERELAYTSHARRLLDLATREATERKSDLAAEHLLLAAFHEPRGALAKLLAEAAVPPAQARTELLRSLGEPPAPAADRPPKPPTADRPRPDRPERIDRKARPAARPAATPAPKRPTAERARSDAPPPPPAASHPRVLPHLRKQPSVWGPVSRRVMLLAVPAALAAEYVLHSPAVVIFGLSCLAVLPLAGFMGDATEHLSARTGPTIGGLLNATFGNAAELIIAIVALQAGLVDLVKASITGSIIGNLLLILGLSLVAGGVRRPELRFNRTTAGMSATMLAAAVVGLVFPALFHASTEGPGSLRAPLIAALAAGLIVGAMAQRSRFCTMGGFRDALLFRDFHLLWGAVALVATVLLGNLILGKFHLGFSDQPIAHTDGLWNFMGMALAGWGSVLLGGCPLRQLILSGEGNSDSAVTVAGLITGAAICHNFGLASSAKGPTANGQIAVALGFVILAIVTYFNLQKEAK